MTDVARHTPTDVVYPKRRRGARVLRVLAALSALWRRVYIPLQLSVIGLTGSASAATPETALEEARRLAREYRYDEALTVLSGCARGGIAPEALVEIDLTTARYLHALNRADEA